MTTTPTNREIKLARALVHPEKQIRDDTLQSLQDYLRTLTTYEELELLKLWKALYYCFWMADKVPVQTELAEKYSQLIHHLKSNELVVGYIQCFYRIILREWSLLDQYRVNKFYILLRLVLRESIKYYYQFHTSQSSNNTKTDKKQQKKKTAVWKDIRTFLDILQLEVLSKVPNGVRYHICDIYLQELARITEGKLETEDFLVAIQPFINALTHNDDMIYIDRVQKTILLKFLNEYSYEAYKIHEKEKETIMQTEEQEDDNEEVPVITTEEHAFFINVNTKQIQKIIFDLASSPETNDRFRKRLYDLHKIYATKTGVPFVTGDMLGAAPNATDSKGLVIEAANAVSVGSKRKHEEEEVEKVVEEEKVGKKAKKQKNKSKEVEPVLQQEISNGKDHKEEKKTIKSSKVSNKVVETKKEVKPDKVEEKNVEVPVKVDKKEEAPVKAEKKSKKEKKVTIVENPPSTTVTPMTNATAKTTTPEKSEEIPTFVESKKFSGRRIGYVFKKGGNGIGYYKDTPPVVVKGILSSGKSNNNNKQNNGKRRKDDFYSN